LCFTLDCKRIYREWGLIGGMIQGNFHDYEPINEGKANALNPEEAALADYHRVIKQKVKEGYVKTDCLIDLPDLPDHLEAFDLDNIPTAFCCSKPTQKISAKAIDKLVRTGNAKFFAKYNGGCHYIRVDSMGEVTIFTRRWDDHTAKYPFLVQAVKDHKIPLSTLMIVEICIDPGLGLDHMTAFKKFAAISKVDTVKGVVGPNVDETIVGR